MNCRGFVFVCVSVFVLGCDSKKENVGDVIVGKEWNSSRSIIQIAVSKPIIQGVGFVPKSSTEGVDYRAVEGDALTKYYNTKLMFFPTGDGVFNTDLTLSNTLVPSSELVSNEAQGEATLSVDFRITASFSWEVAAGSVYIKVGDVMMKKQGPILINSRNILDVLQYKAPEEQMEAIKRMVQSLDDTVINIAKESRAGFPKGYTVKGRVESFTSNSIKMVLAEPSKEGVPYELTR